jgi:hypothetical protein
MTASHNRRNTALQSPARGMSMLRGEAVECRLLMPTIAEVDGTRIMMFPFDHDPPHIHAFGPDFRAKLGIS